MIKGHRFSVVDAIPGAFAGGLFGFCVGIIAGFEGLWLVLFTAVIMFCYIMFFGLQRVDRNEREEKTENVITKRNSTGIRAKANSKHNRLR